MIKKATGIAAILFVILIIAISIAKADTHNVKELKYDSTERNSQQLKTVNVKQLNTFKSNFHLKTTNKNLFRFKVADNKLFVSEEKSLFKSEVKNKEENKAKQFAELKKSKETLRADKLFKTASVKFESASVKFDKGDAFKLNKVAFKNFNKAEFFKFEKAEFKFNGDFAPSVLEA